MKIIKKIKQMRRIQNEKVKNGLTKNICLVTEWGDLGRPADLCINGSICHQILHECLQVDLRIMAVLLLIWNVWDAVNEPMMGAIMDKIYAKNHNRKGEVPSMDFTFSSVLVTITAIMSLDSAEHSLKERLSFSCIVFL